MLHVDKAYFAVNGISIKNEALTPTMTMACIKEQMIDAADKVLLLADSSKIGRTAFEGYAPDSVSDVMITDAVCRQQFCRIPAQYRGQRDLCEWIEAGSR